MREIMLRLMNKGRRSSISRSPSPRTKRLRRAQAEKEPTKVTQKEREKSHGRTSDKSTHQEKGLDREIVSERNDKRGFDRDIETERMERTSGRDESSRSTRSRHERSTLDQPRRSRLRSRSPQSADGARSRHEVSGDIHPFLSLLLSTLLVSVHCSK